jgi:hypothetical protein
MNELIHVTSSLSDKDVLHYTFKKVVSGIALAEFVCLHSASGLTIPFPLRF